MLKNFPPDFRYIFGLQEATVVGMADGFAQATMQPTLAVLHTVAGTGNAMGNIMTAFLNKSPLVIIAGNQARPYLVADPYLTDRQPELLPLPWVKWAYEPARAEDVPAALVRAIAMASMPPAGPVFLSVPLDDWTATIDSTPAIRTVSTKIAPDPDRLAAFAARISEAKNVTLILGEEVDYSLGWDAAINLAELLNAHVYEAPLQARVSFPANNPLYRNSLPLGQASLANALKGYDLALVVGAEVYRYYPYEPGPVSPPGLDLLQITTDPHDAGAALVGDSLLSDTRLALEGLYALLRTGTSTSSTETTRPSQTATAPAQSTPKNSTSLMTAFEAFQAVALLRESSDLLVQESPSNVGQLLAAWPIVEPMTYFTSASGGLGWGGPASVGIALAQTNRTTVLVIGDGSLQYSVQSIYSAVQHNINLIMLVPRNEEYAILKEFAIFEDTPNCRECNSSIENSPCSWLTSSIAALDLPGLNAQAVAEAYGCTAIRADTPADLYDAFQQARRMGGPVLIEFQIDPALQPLPV